MGTESFLRVGIDGTAAQDGAKVVTRSMDDIQVSAKATVTAIDSIKTAVSSIAALAIIQLAVELMKLGATAQVTQQAFESMAEAQGVNANAMLESMKNATAGTVDDIALMHEGMKGLAADLSPEIVAGLAGAARTAAQMTGTTVQEAMDRIIDGIATGMPRALKQVMVITKDQLAALTKGQAFMDPGEFQADMAEMVKNNDIIKSYELQQTAVNNATEAQQKFKAVWEDTKATIGSVVDSLFPPLVGMLQVIYASVLAVVGAFIRLGETIMNTLALIPGLKSLATGNVMGDTLKKMQDDAMKSGFQNIGLIDKDKVAPKYTADDAARAKAENDKILANVKAAAEEAAMYKSQADEIKSLMAQEKQRYDQTMDFMKLRSTLEEDYYKNIKDLSTRAASDEKAMVEMQKAGLEDLYKSGLLNEHEYFDAKFGYMQTDIDTVRSNTADAIAMDNAYYASRIKNLTDEYTLSQSYTQQQIADTHKQYDAERASASAKKGQLGDDGVAAEIAKLDQQERTAIEALNTQLIKSGDTYYKDVVDMDTKALNSKMDNLTTLRNAQIKSYTDALTLAQQYQDKANAIAAQVQSNKDKLDALFATAQTPDQAFYSAYKSAMAGFSNDSGNATNPQQTQAAMDQLLSFMQKYKDFKTSMGGSSDFEMTQAKQAFTELNSKLTDMSNDAQSMSNQLLQFAANMKDAITQSNAGIVSLEREMKNLGNQIINVPPLNLDTSQFMDSIRQAQSAVSGLSASLGGGTNDAGSSGYFSGVTTSTDEYGNTFSSNIPSAATMPSSGNAGVSVGSIVIQGAQKDGQQLAREIDQGLATMFKRGNSELQQVMNSGA